MAGQTGITDATNRVVLMGEAPIKTLHNVETATNMYAGRVVQKGTTDFDIVVGSGATTAPKGFLGYEDTPQEGRPANKDTLYTASKKGMVLRGGGFIIDAMLAPYATAVLNDDLFSWADGCLFPGQVMGGMTAIKIPFVKKTSEFDTGVDLPAGAIVHGVLIEATTTDNSGTIDVGLLYAENSNGGDLDGFVDGVSLATAGMQTLGLIDGTDASNTIGAYLYEAAVKSADASALFARVPKVPGYVVGSTQKSVSYTTSNHDVAGNIWILISAAGVKKMAVAEEAVTTTTAAARIHARAVA
jgi:hypothetical protein